MNPYTFDIPTDRRINDLSLSNIFEMLLIDNQINDVRLKAMIVDWLTATKPGQSPEVQDNEVTSRMNEIKGPNLSWPSFLDGLNIIGYPTLLLQV